MSISPIDRSIAGPLAYKYLCLPRVVANLAPAEVGRIFSAAKDSQTFLPHHGFHFSAFCVAYCFNLPNKRATPPSVPVPGSNGNLLFAHGCVFGSLAPPPPHFVVLKHDNETQDTIMDNEKGESFQTSQMSPQMSPQKTRKRPRPSTCPCPCPNSRDESALADPILVPRFAPEQTKRRIKRTKQTKQTQETQETQETQLQQEGNCIKENETQKIIKEQIKDENEDEDEDEDKLPEFSVFANLVSSSDICHLYALKSKPRLSSRSKSESH